MSRVLRRSIVAILLVAGAAGLVFYWTRPETVLVTARAVERGTVAETVVNTRAGAIRACRRARLAPAAGGLVVRLPAREGDRVQAGQVLLELWNVDLKAQLELAESEFRSSEARAREVCAGARHAEREAERLRGLDAQGIVETQVLDRAVAEAESSAAACSAAEAAAEVSKARIALARAALERTVVKAPFSGVIAEVDAELAEYVTPSPPGIPTPPAIDLIEEGCIYVEAPIDEVDAGRVRAGMRARVTLDAFPDQEFEGTVRRIAPYVLELERQARTVDIHVELDALPAGAVLLPGYSADVEVFLAVEDGVLRVPTESIIREDRLLVLESGVLHERTVVTGLSNWRYTAIVDGLREGEIVVTSVDRDGIEAGAAAAVENGAGGAKVP